MKSYCKLQQTEVSLKVCPENTFSGLYFLSAGLDPPSGRRRRLNGMPAFLTNAHQRPILFFPIDLLLNRTCKQDAKNRTGLPTTRIYYTLLLFVLARKGITTEPFMTLLSWQRKPFQLNRRIRQLLQHTNVWNHERKQTDNKYRRTGTQGCTT